MAYVGQGDNVNVHMRIDNITEYFNKDGNTSIMVKGTSKTIQRDPNSRDGYKVVSSVVAAFCRSYLKEYIKQELEEGNNVFIIGHLTSSFRKIGSGGATIMQIEIECIYKEDFLNYFPKEWREPRLASTGRVVTSEENNN